jgi:spoIIIJ-associated protein
MNETRQIDTQTANTDNQTASQLESPGDSPVDSPAENTVEESTPASADDSPEALDSAEGADAGDDGATGGADDVRPGRRERLEQEGDIAADYLEELLEISDLDGDLDMDVEGDRATVSIVGADLPQLVGDQGEVLEALQELTRLAVYRETGERSRLMLDVSGHRAQRRTALEEQAARVVAEVKESGERATLEPMTPFERKVVHDVVAAAGLTSESEGTEPRRFVVVLPE